MKAPIFPGHASMLGEGSAHLAFRKIACEALRPGFYFTGPHMGPRALYCFTSDLTGNGLFVPDLSLLVLRWSRLFSSR